MFKFTPYLAWVLWPSQPSPALSSGQRLQYLQVTIDSQLQAGPCPLPNSSIRTLTLRLWEFET